MRPLTTGSFSQEQGSAYGTPTEIWGFRTPAPKKGTYLKTVARRFLEANKKLLGLENNIETLDFDDPRVINSAGAHHLIYRQEQWGYPVHRGYVTVHMDLDRRIYLAKNRAVPSTARKPEWKFRITDKEAIDSAYKWARTSRAKARVKDCKRMWLYVEGYEFVPAKRVRLIASHPREDWIIFVDAENAEVLSGNDVLSHLTGKARVFDPNPVAALGDHKLMFRIPGKRYLRKPPENAYVEVELLDLPDKGTLDGKRVTTRPTKSRLRRKNGDFRLWSKQQGFEEAMVYYHLDQAIRYVESLGYVGRRIIFSKPLEVNVNGTKEDNAYYSPGENMLVFGTGGVDCGEDGETILHEFGHALQDAICPGFGQSPQAAAIGEAFGDYLAASYFADKKPVKYRTSVMCWDGINLNEGTDGVPFDPPCVRRVDDDWTFEDFNADDPAHENGKIWSATLWDIRCKLDRDSADRLIIESHFQLDGFTKFKRAARAILDADQNLFGGVHRKKLEKIFAARLIEGFNGAAS